MSDARLPELERFRVGGAHRRAGHPGARWAAVERRRRPRPSTTTRVPAASGSRSRWPRRPHRGDGVAAPAALSARALHERRRADPALDLRRARLRARARGLPRGGEDAFLVTARTDTGKTTTSLRMLDQHPYSFLSDDLTLVTPGGRVLTYPKPLTISRHTLTAVKTPSAVAPGTHRPARPEPAALTLGPALRPDPRAHPPACRDDQRARPDAGPSAEVPRGAAGTRRRGGPRGAACRDGRDRARRRGSRGRSTSARRSTR